MLSSLWGPCANYICQSYQPNDEKGIHVVLLEIFSRRKRNAQKTGDDVYQYEEFPKKLRNQILFIFDEWNEQFESYGDSSPIYKGLVELMRKELGQQTLTGQYANSVNHEFTEWFRSSQSIDDLIDSMEIAVRFARYYGEQDSRHSERYERGLAELNARMLEAGFGFQFENGDAIQASSTFLHQKVVVPAFYLLSSSDFVQPNEEFRQAYDEFNHGNFDDCIHDCCNAFESVLKVILTQKGWAFDPNKDTVNKLLSIAFNNGLIPAYMQTEFAGLRAILESGVPTVRNKIAGHGAGVNPRQIPKYIAAFQLHQTAAAIVLLVEASKT
jgi:hypothetical protein